VRVAELPGVFRDGAVLGVSGVARSLTEKTVEDCEMTLEEARSRMAELDVEYDDLIGDSIVTDQSPKNAEIERVSRERQQLGKVLAGFPHIRPHLSAWMVDVVGSESNATGESEMKEAVGVLLDEGASESFLSRVGGSLAQQVDQFIRKDCGRNPPDGGGGCTSWHIGTPCNDEQCASLTAAIHERFAKAIAAGLLTVRVSFWGWRFRD